MSNGGREVGLVFNLNGCGGGSGSVKLKSFYLDYYQYYRPYPDAEGLPYL